MTTDMRLKSPACLNRGLTIRPSREETRQSHQQ